MSRKLKMLPAFIMLLAGALTSIITYLVHYETKIALIILLCVMLLFYILGVILQKLIVSFEKANKLAEEEREKAENAEGKVVEKEGSREEENS